MKEASEFLQRTLTRVVVNADELQIELESAALRAELLGTSTPTEEHSSACITLREPLQIVRRGSEVRLILSSGEHRQNEQVPSLIRAVAQARTWSEWIVRGEVSTLNELAARAGLNRHYTSRILRLAALSPQLVEAIMNGQHSPLLTVVGVTDNLPLDWTLQQLTA